MMVGIYIVVLVASFCLGGLWENRRSQRALRLLRVQTDDELKRLAAVQPIDTAWQDQIGRFTKRDP